MMARTLRKAADIAKMMLNLRDVALIDQLALYDDVVYAQVWEYTEMDDTIYDAMKDTKKQLFESIQAEIIIYKWNQSDNLGVDSKSNGFTTEKFSVDLPESIWKQLDMFKPRYLAM
jgi:hypothetical protein